MVVACTPCVRYQSQVHIWVTHSRTGCRHGWQNNQAPLTTDRDDQLRPVLDWRFGSSDLFYVLGHVVRVRNASRDLWNSSIPWHLPKQVAVCQCLWPFVFFFRLVLVEPPCRTPNQCPPKRNPMTRLETKWSLSRLTFSLCSRQSLVGNSQNPDEMGESIFTPGRFRYKLWQKIIYPFPSFNGGAIEVSTHHLLDMWLLMQCWVWS